MMVWELCFSLEMGVLKVIGPIRVEMHVEAGALNPWQSNHSG